MVFHCQPICPRWLVQDSLDHERVDVNQADLQEMQRQHGDLLILNSIRGDFAAPPVQDEIVAIVPVLDHLQTAVDFAP